MFRVFRWLLPLVVVMASSPCLPAAEKETKYFAHKAVEDSHGVIAPWYKRLNGQCDFRVRVAAETLKRYPWADRPTAITPGPCYIFSGHWKISPEGKITPTIKLKDWHNGDLGQRSAYIIGGLINYYRYTGDPAAIGPITINADYLLDYCQTPAEHPWPEFLISCPVRGKAYHRANPRGHIQLDYACQVGLGMAAAYRLTGEKRYLEAIKHWADLLAAHCDHTPGAAPWGRYANPKDVKKMSNRMTGGVVLVLLFLDEVIRLGHTGTDGALLKARDAGERYLREELLPRWMEDPTWGNHFWDWQNPVCTVVIPCFAAQYMMDHPDRFPNWRADCRNIITLFFARATVSPRSAGGPYSGAWSLPESSSCCGRSLQYSTQLLAPFLLRYGRQADSPWATELGRRMTILGTYDAHENGVVEDLVGGGPYVSKTWFNLAHPFPMKCVLDSISFEPGLFAASRENHIVRSSSVVSSVVYGKDRIEYETFPDPGEQIDVLRLAFAPRSVAANDEVLPVAKTLDENGYTVDSLENGDCIVTIRHDGRAKVVVEGDDPQQTADDSAMQFRGDWEAMSDTTAFGGSLRASAKAGAEATCTFDGNQVRLIGRAGPSGGEADIWLDGVKQAVGLDCWCPKRRDRQVLYYKNGLTQGKHTLRVVVRGKRNPVSKGDAVYVDGLQWSAATGATGFGEGSGPTGAQRVILGYCKRKDYVDTKGRRWRPATEVLMRISHRADLVPIAFWTQARAKDVAGTEDPELYRYGMHGNDFTVHLTVSPSETYHVRIKLAELQKPDKPGEFATSIAIQGKEVVRDMDIAATAGGYGKAADLVFNGIRPKNGLISVRFFNPHGKSAMAQAVEIGPGGTGGGVKPVAVSQP